MNNNFVEEVFINPDNYNNYILIKDFGEKYVWKIVNNKQFGIGLEIFNI